MFVGLLLAAVVGPEGPAATPLESQFEARVRAALEREEPLVAVVSESRDLLPALLDRWLFAALVEEPPDRGALEAVSRICDRLRLDSPPLLDLSPERIAEWREALAAYRAARSLEEWEAVVSGFESLGDRRRVALARLALSRLEGLAPERARAEASTARGWAERSGDAALLALALSVESDVLRDGDLPREALGASRRALEIHRSLGDRRGEAEDERAIAVARGRLGLALGRGGREEEAREQLDEAIAAFTRAMEGASEVADEALRLRALRGRGSTWERLGRRSLAAKDLEEALDAYERRGESLEAARVHSSLGDMLREGNPSRALDHFARAARTFEEEGSASREAAQCWQQYALALEDRGGVDGGSPGAALKYYRLAGEVFERRGDPHWLAEVVEGEARVHLKLGDTRRAAEAAERALALYERSGDPRRRSSMAVLLLGAAACGEGRYVEAERLFERALGISRRDAWKSAMGRCLVWLGDLRAWQRRFREAAGHLEEARALLAEEPVAWIEATQKLALVTKEEGSGVEADRLFEEAESKAREVRLPVAVARLLAERAVAEVEKRPALALDLVGRARGALEGLEAPSLRARVSGIEADSHLFLDRFEEARGEYLRVLEALGGEADPRDNALLRLGLAEACLRSERIEEARVAWGEAASGLAELRSSSGNEIWQIPLQERFDRLPRVGVEVFVRVGDDAGALEAAQDAQGRALADALEGGVPAEGPLLERLRARLPADESFVAYAQGLDGVFAFVVRGGDIRRFDLGPPGKLEEAALAFRRQCESPAPASAESVGEFARAGERLRDLAWTPLASALEGCRSIVVAPGATLAGVAFEALPLEVSRVATSFGAIRYAVEETSFSYVPSARVFVALAEIPRGRGSGLLAAADPDYGTPHEVESGTPRGVQAVVASGGETFSLPPLPFSRVEATAVANLFAEDERVLRLGREARREALTAQRALERSRFVLLSVHGQGDEDRPESCGLWLSTPGPGKEPEFFGARDLDGRRLLADLVVLSACRTARGVRSSGEGVLSLAREFLRAGARAVLASEWLVADAAGAQISVSFHEGVVRDGLDGVEALRRAKLRYLRQPKPDPALAQRGTPPPRPLEAPDPAHPFFWAPLLLFGPPE